VYVNGYISRAAFASQKELFLTVGHELTHTQHYVAGLHELFGENFWYNSERASLDWNYFAAKDNRWQDVILRYERFIRKHYPISAEDVFKSTVNTNFVK